VFRAPACCGAGNEQSKGRTVKRDFANNVNQKMRFKVNFPTCCSHAAGA
jgi:hypothetical protein